MSEHLLATVVAALVVAAMSAFGRLMISRLPEPEPVPDVPVEPVETAGLDETSGPASPEAAVQALRTTKPLYVDLAARPGLGAKLAATGVVVGAVVGAQLGWQPVLAAWVYLAGVGVVLGYIDAQTSLLPTRLIAPSYAILVLLIAAAGLAEGDGDLLIRSGLGWLALGGFYFVMWLVYPKGLGYGDVRLSGLLGLALGYLGWAELLTGMYAGFLLGGVIGGLLAVVKVFDRKRYPFGPFMLSGALVGLVWGPELAAWYLSF